MFNNYCKISNIINKINTILNNKTLNDIICVCLILYITLIIPNILKNDNPYYDIFIKIHSDQFFKMLNLTLIVYMSGKDIKISLLLLIAYQTINNHITKHENNYYIPIDNDIELINKVADKMNSEKLNSRKLSSQKIDSQKIDSQKIDSQKIDSQRLNFQKIDSEKSNSEKSNQENRYNKNKNIQNEGFNVMSYNDIEGNSYFLDKYFSLLDS